MRPLFTLVSESGRTTYEWFQEAPRSRTLLNRGELVRVRLPWVQHARVRTALVDSDLVDHTANLWFGGEEVASPDHELRELQLPNCQGAGTFCLGDDAQLAVDAGELDPAEAFWNTDFEEYAINGGEVVGTHAVEVPALHQLPWMPDRPRLAAWARVALTPASLVERHAHHEETARLGVAWRASARYQREQRERAAAGAKGQRRTLWGMLGRGV